MKWIILILPLVANAGFSTLDNTYKYDFKEDSRPKKKRTIKKNIKRNDELDSLLEKLKKQDKEIAEYLDKNDQKLIIRKSEDSLRTLTRIRGVLLNSVLATNQRPTTLVIKLEDNEYFDAAEVRCKGISYGKRVVGQCDVLVTDDKEYQIEAELWDLDGAEGVIADQFYSGEEKEFLTSSFSSFFEGVLRATKDRLVTPFGEVDRRNGKNQVLSGLIGIADNAKNKIKNSAERNLQIALVNSGKTVFLFFQKEVKL